MAASYSDKVRDILSTKLFSLALIGHNLQWSRFKLVDFVKGKSSLNEDELKMVLQRIIALRQLIVEFITVFSHEPLTEYGMELLHNVFYAKELNREKIFGNNKAHIVRIDRYFSGASPHFPEELIPEIINYYKNFLALTSLD